jgi:formate/nitrite transporter FocA (FNT family)
MAEGLIADKLNSPQTSELVTKLGYPIGFIVPILGRQQLFTENTLTPIVPFLSEPNAANFKKVARLWGIVLVTNLIGAAIAGLICAVPQIFSTSTRLQFTQIAQSAIEGSFLSILLKGVIAGWFIALLTWLLGGVKHGEVALIFLLTYLVGIGGFPHIVVAGSIGSYLISQALMNLKECLINYFLPTLIGNIIGGIGLVAVLNHAQVVAGRHTKENPK